MTARRDEVLTAIEAEADCSDTIYGDFASMHEAYGVLAEEVSELFAAVRLRQENPERGPHIAREAIQIAATCLRIAEQAHRVTR